MSAIGAALASLNAAVNIAKAMINLRDAAALQSKVIEFQSAILEAQGSALVANDERTALIQRVGQLEKQVADLEAWDTEKKRYELRALGSGTLAYALKAEAKGSEPSHWICATCYEKGQKSILQRTIFQQYGMWPHNCHSCKAVVYGDEQP